MIDSRPFFTLADTDDASALTNALVGAPDSYRLRNEAGETLFLYCVFRGKAKCADVLKARGNLSLHEAALAGDAQRVAALATVAPWSVDTLSADGWTALHLAAFLGQDAVISRLLELGADARICSRAFEQNYPIHAAAAGRRVGKQAYSELVAATGDPDILQKQGLTALMIAAGNGFDGAVDVLLGAGAKRGCRTSEGKTAAHFARERGHEALAARLAP